jgi:hypothetical protein
VFSFVASLFFRLSRIFTASEKVIPLYKNQLSARYFSINAQNKQDDSCFFALIGNAFYKKDAVPSQSSADELSLTRDDLEWPPLALWPSSAERIIYNFAFVALCGALQTHFHGRGRNGKRHLQRRFPRKRGAVGERLLPLGELSRSD